MARAYIITHTLRALDMIEHNTVHSRGWLTIMARAYIVAHTLRALDMIDRVQCSTEWGQSDLKVMVYFSCLIIPP